MKLKKLLAVCLSAVSIFGAGVMAACGERTPHGGDSSGGDYGDVTFDAKSGEMYLGSKEGKTPVKITYSEGNGNEWIRSLSASFLQAEEERITISSSPSIRRRPPR